MSAMNHDEAFRLLPWLVNGTLTGAERDRVEGHVRDCLACRAELRGQQALREGVRRLPDLHVSAEQGFAALAERLEPRVPPGARGADDHSAATHARPAHRVWSVSRRLALAAGVVLAVGAALWAGYLERTERLPAYRTLTTPNAGAGVRIDVVFAAGVSEKDLRDVVTGIGGTLVAGPTALGRYTIRLENQPDDAEVDALIARLQRDPRVRFAGRSFIGNEGKPEAGERSGSP